MRPARMLANYRTLLADPAYRGALLIGCGAFAALFAFISGSPFVFIEHFGLSPQQMGLAFGLNVTGFMIGSTLSARHSRRLGPARLIRHGVWIGAACGVPGAASSSASTAGPVICGAIGHCSFGHCSARTVRLISSRNRDRPLNMVGAQGMNLSRLVGVYDKF